VGPKRNEVSQNWRILHNYGLHVFYILPSIVSIVKLRFYLPEHVTRMGNKKYIQNLIEKPLGLQSPGKPRRK
jgi:hypothetical protein